MQTMLPLPEKLGGGALSVSTGMYNPPYSDNYEDIGLEPDIDIELPDEQKEIFYKLSLADDVQFQEALKTVINVDTLVFDTEIEDSDAKTDTSNYKPAK